MRGSTRSTPCCTRTRRGQWKQYRRTTSQRSPSLFRSSERPSSAMDAAATKLGRDGTACSAKQPAAMDARDASRYPGGMRLRARCRIRGGYHAAHSNGAKHVSIRARCLSVTLETTKKKQRGRASDSGMRMRYAIGWESGNAIRLVCRDNGFAHGRGGGGDLGPCARGQWPLATTNTHGRDAGNEHQSTLLLVQTRAGEDSGRLKSLHVSV